MRGMRRLPKTIQVQAIALGILVALHLASCSSEEITNAPPKLGPKVTITGVAQAGPIKGDITIYKLLSSGERGQKIATTSSDGNGQFSVEVPSMNEPVIITATGTYTDEATGLTVDMRGQELTQILSETLADRKAPVTPLTTMVHDAVVENIRQGESGTSIIKDTLQAKTAEVAKLFGVPDQVLNELPTKPESASINTPAGQAATVLIILSQSMKEAGLTPDKDVNPIAAIRALSREFAATGTLGSSSAPTETIQPENVKALASGWAQQLSVSREKVLSDSKAEPPKEWSLPKTNYKIENQAPMATDQKIKVVGSSSAASVKASDPNRDALKFVVVEQGALGDIEFVDQFSGRFTYTLRPQPAIPPQPGVSTEPASSEYVKSDKFTYKVTDGQLESSVATVTIDRVPASGVLLGKCYKNGEVFATLPDGTGYCAPTGEYYVDYKFKPGLDNNGSGKSGDRLYHLGKLARGFYESKCYRDGLVAPSLDDDGTGFCIGNSSYYIQGKPAIGLDEFGNGVAGGFTYRAGKKFSGVNSNKCYSAGVKNLDLDEQGNGTCNGFLYVSGKTANGLIGSNCYSGGERTNSLTNGSGWCHGLVNKILPSNITPEAFSVRAFTIDKNYDLLVAHPTCVRKIVGEISSKVIAGDCDSAGYADASGVNARFTDITAIATHTDGTIYIAESTPPMIRKISPAGVVTTLFKKSKAPLTGYNGIAVDQSKNIFFGDEAIYRMTETSPPVLVTYISFRGPAEMTVTKDGNLLVYDKSLRITNLVMNPQTINEETRNIADLIEQVGYNEYGGVSKNIPEGSYPFKCSVFNSLKGIYSSIPLVGHLNLWLPQSQLDTFYKNIGAIGGDRIDFRLHGERDCRSIVEGRTPDYYFIQSGGLYRISKGSYYEKGSPRPEFDYRGSGNFDGKRYSEGLLLTGFSSQDRRCYINGVADAAFTAWDSGSYCAADKLYYAGGSAKPGLDSGGNGTSDGLRYVNGERASGFVEGKYYSYGSLYTGDYEGKCYSDGQVFTGVTSGKCYVEGDSGITLKYYIGGVLGTGLFEGRYYQNGFS
ncbi:MAG: Ig-like domain-containing protein, partial [bacterium]